MSVTLIFDIAIAVLLVITISYAVVLNRRLMSLRRDRKELEKVAGKFEKSFGRAQESITKLKTSTEELRQGIRKAESLREDLAFLLDRGGSAADRLEAAVRAARKEGGATNELKAEIQEAGPEGAKMESARTKGAGTKSYRTDSAAKAPAENAGSDDGNGRRKLPSGENRSSAEEDLLRALQAAR